MKNYQIGMYEKAVPEELSISEILSCGKKAGYNFFEISIDRTEKRISRLYDRDFQLKLIEHQNQIDFPVGSMCLSALGTYTLGNPDPNIEKRSIDIFCHAIDFAERLGLRIVQIPACDVPKNEVHTEETNQRFIDNLRLLIDYASAHSVMIGLENMEDSYMDSVEKCMGLINKINSPYFMLYSDSGNITSASVLNRTKTEKDMLFGRNKYCAFHLKETRPNKYGGLFYGEGHVNFQNIMKTAWRDLGIRRFVLEYWYTGNQKWEDDLIFARQLSEKWIRNACLKGNVDE